MSQSLYGTSVDGVAVAEGAPHPLRNGSQIQLGSFTLRFRL